MHVEVDISSVKKKKAKWQQNIKTIDVKKINPEEEGNVGNE